MSFWKELLPHREGTLDERRGALAETQAQVNLPDHIHHRGLQQRLIGELIIDTLGPALEELSRRDRISERLTGIGHLEEIDQECGNLLRLRLPDLRPVTLLPGYACLPERARQPDHERERDEQPCQGAYSIAPDEAGGPIGDRRGPRADRLEPQMAANVVR